MVEENPMVDNTYFINELQGWQVGNDRSLEICNFAMVIDTKEPFLRRRSTWWFSHLVIGL